MDACSVEVGVFNFNRTKSDFFLLSGFPQVYPHPHPHPPPVPPVDTPWTSVAPSPIGSELTPRCMIPGTASLYGAAWDNHSVVLNCGSCLQNAHRGLLNLKLFKSGGVAFCPETLSAFCIWFEFSPATPPLPLV